MPPVPFRDRREAGQKLAEKLSGYAGDPRVIVLALPRGGVPVGWEVARALGVPLDVFVVRKLGVPGFEELAMGAVASGGVRVLNDEVVFGLRIPDEVIEDVEARERAELERRERLYRGGRALADVRGRTVILVDDGLATGSTMLAAVRALRQRGPARIVVAVPTAPPDTCRNLSREADEVICYMTPEPFFGVGGWYEDFSQTSDDEVRELLSFERDPQRASSASDRRAEGSLAGGVRLAARRLNGSAGDYDALLERIGDARLVLLGEATHGTHEFYRERERITRRLIQEKGFCAIAVEADWPDAQRVNRWVHGEGGDLDAADALADFGRFPSWMWRNTDVVRLVEWLREHNDAAADAGRAKVGFYGLDLYSLHSSMKAVLRYLERVDPRAAETARRRFACFEQFGADARLYGLMAGSGLADSCEEEVVRQLVELERKACSRPYASASAEDELFIAEQNARVVRNAERYYRSMFLSRESSWNLRDRHMMETLDELDAHLGRPDAPAKIVVWAHNSHVGDARATGMRAHDELNLGQLVREKHGNEAVLVGFTTHHGTVTAASDWDRPAERKTVRPALPGSYEALFHATGLGRLLLVFREGGELERALAEPRLERAIGVIYRPETERESHYFEANLPAQFDAVIHLDATRAVEPLERSARWEAGDAPETFPFAV